MPQQPLSLYIHIPFCPQKCHYCAFLSMTDYSCKTTYVQALCHEIQERSVQYKKRTIQSIYVGGGCPTLLTKQEWKNIIQTLRHHFIIDTQTEWTVEIQPSTTTIQYVQFLLQQGVNRFSFGIQSFNPTVRKISGRKGSIRQAVNLIQQAHIIGCPTIGIDLIMGLPGQTLEILKDDLKKATSLPIQHISLYFLSLEPHTVFSSKKRNFHFPSDEHLTHYYHTACSYLHEQEFQHYEVSNWARDNKECYHNKAYWNQQEYIGFGLGAHSYLHKKRFANTKQIEQYLSSHYKTRTHNNIQTIAEQWEEYILLSLRTKYGIYFQDVVEKFGKQYLDQLQKKLQMTSHPSLLYITPEKVQITEQGWLLLDAIIIDLLL